MNQNLAWGAVVGGVLIAVGTEVLKISEWSQIATPAFVGALCLQVGGVCAAIWGAIQVRPRV